MGEIWSRRTKVGTLTGENLFNWFVQFSTTSAETLIHAVTGLAGPFVFFAALALIVKKRSAIQGLRNALPETGITLKLMAFNLVFISPLLVAVAVGLSQVVGAFELQFLNEDFWNLLPSWAVCLIAIFIGDLTGYWRHRLEHSSFLWPSHAIHHSDTQMTWLALERFHPINRLTTVIIDSSVLLLFGFPPFAIVANNLVRHYYGYFIHADLPWTYGPLGKIFVSPAMHRWHHAAAPKAYGTNFATVFAIFDRAFGTYRVPGSCTVPLGVDDDMGEGMSGQLLYPFNARAYRSPAYERRQTALGRSA